MTRTAPSHMMRPSDALSQRARNAMGLPPDRSDPTPRRKALLEYISEHGPLIAAHMTPAGQGAKQRLIWLQKEGYATCERSNTNTGALWSITPMGKRWIVKYDGEPVKPRTRAFSGCATEAHETRWPDVAAGRMVAYTLQSRGIE